LILGLALAVLAQGAIRPGHAATPVSEAAAAFEQLVEREWEWRLREFPLLATSVGDHRFDDRLADESLAACDRRDRESRAFLAELDAIDPSALTAADRVDYGILRAQLVERLDEHRFGEDLMPLNADSGFHTSFALLPLWVPTSTRGELEAYLSRLEAFPVWMEQHVERMRAGLARGLTIPRATLEGIDQPIVKLAGGPVEEHPLFAPFAELSPQVPEADRERLVARARTAIAEAIQPAYRRFLEFLRSEYLPGARTSLAATDLPDGAAYYEFLIRKYTTRELDAGQIHELGRSELAEIRRQMGEVIARTGFEGGFAEFLEFLRSDPRFYPESAEQLLREASWIAKRMDAKLPSLFGRLPRQPYGVMPVPEALAPKYTAGRYSSSPRDSTEPGWYWVNTWALETRPLYNLEALTLHEAVPGHHLQNALAEEQEGLRPFRRYSYVSAYGEGWGLYSEWLGREAGFYTDPYSEFGFLGYQAWRAARLVVDTGLHAFGWSRDRAIAFLAENSSLPLHEARTEVDRYISWPGQALSYYVGYLGIRELRQRAEAELGERFDVREFHDRVLGLGAVPLPVLDRAIAEWIESRRGAEAPE